MIVTQSLHMLTYFVYYICIHQYMICYLVMEFDYNNINYQMLLGP